MSIRWASRLGALQAAAGVAAIVLSSAGCLGGSGLSNGESSVEELALAVLDAFERKDIERLRELAMSEEEFRDVVWPELPAARSERNLSFSYVWGDLRERSGATLSASLEQYGGQDFVLVNITFQQEMSQYQSYLVHRDSLLRVLDTDGREHDLRLFGSVLERGGQFKVFSYVVD